jgi:hypothetical protein
VSWHRAFNRKPCPICGHIGYCTATKDGVLVNCARTPNNKPLICKATGEVWGYLYRTDNAQRQHVTSLRGNPAADKLPWIEIELIRRRERAAVNSHRLKTHARSLGVSADALDNLRIGWNSERQAWSFPMSDAGGRCVGLRYRRDDGAKWSLRGGSSGLFVPTIQPESDTLIICEGATSSAAWLDMGFAVIGRCSCNGGGAALSTMLEWEHRRVFVMADRDSKKTRPDGSTFRPGPDGAFALYQQLINICDVKWGICPVAKDGREMLKRGVPLDRIKTWINKHFHGGMTTEPVKVKMSA